MLHRRGDALDGVAEVVDPVVAGVVVLDRAADGPRLGRAPDRGCRLLGAAPYPFSRSTEIGSSTASASARVCSTTSSSATPLSCRPSVNAKPELVVASAWKPSPASTFADPASQGFGMTNGSPSCSVRKRTPFSCWLIIEIASHVVVV